MTHVDPGRPGAGEYIPYYEQYIRLVPDGDIVDILERQLAATLASTTSLAPERARGSAAPEGWSASEVVGHLADAERVFAYRALRFARGDHTPLPGVGFDAYVPAGSFHGRSLTGVVEEFASVRRATVTLLRGLDEEAWTRSGLGDGQRVSVRALAHILAGHEAHHIGDLCGALDPSRARG